MLKQYIVRFLAISLIVSCASGHRSTSVKLREYVMAGSFDKAVEYLKASPLAIDEKSKLLYHTELGLLEHYQGNYQASNDSLTVAKNLIEELYTTRASGKIKSVISNDNADFYYGEKYEASLVFFYLSLNHYMLSMKEPDAMKKKNFLAQARSEVVAWDSFLTEIKNERLGQALFKEDLLAKTFGALVHESQNNFKDDQIALQLYKDAQAVFFKNYNLFPTFNSSYEAFRKNFSSFPDMAMDEVEGKYVIATQHNNSFKEFLQLKINYLSLRLQRKPSADESTISFLIQDGLIAEKIPQKYEFPMAWGMHQSSALSMGSGAKISFELPAIQGVEKLETSRLQALNKEGVVVAEGPVSVIAPLSDLAQQAINEHSTAIAAKTATRVAAKHITALVASSATYEAGRRNNNSLTMMLALAGHAAATASINASEKADVRFWSTLPSSIRMAHITLPKGIYHFRAVFGPVEAPRKIIELGTHDLNTENSKFVMKSKDLKFTPAPVMVTEPVQVAIKPQDLKVQDRSISGSPAGN